MPSVYDLKDESMQAYPRNHEEPLRECVTEHQAFKEHMEKAQEYRDRVVKLEADVRHIADGLKALGDLKRAIVTSAIAVIFTLLITTASVLIGWGENRRQIAINTARLDYIESIHPRISK